MNKENCALKLVHEIILYYDARSKKHQFINIGVLTLQIQQSPYSTIGFSVAEAKKSGFLL